MNTEEINKLWIGDRIRSGKSGREGLFEGRHPSGKIRMKTAQGVVLVPARYLELVNEEEEEDEGVIDEIRENPPREPFSLLNDELDLHIEILRPDLVNALPERILDVQLRAFDRFMDESRQRNRSKVCVIHGKGAGVLRQHIHQSLSSDPSVQEYRLINNGGATEIYLSGTN